MFRKTIALILCAFMWMPMGARAAQLQNAPLESEVPIDVKAKSAILVEPASGQVIFELNADEHRPIASVTKIMAILLTVEAIAQGRAKLDDSVVISKTAAGMGGSQVLLDEGEIQPLGELLKSMVVASANDATVAVGEHLFGSEQAFVDRMNERAKELGMDNTNFVNSTGLPAQGAHSTARDVAKMSMELIKSPLYFTDSMVWMDELKHNSGRITQITNTNRMIRTYDGADGIKTGSTNEAGYCISATAKRGDMRLIAVVLGSSSGKERFAVAGDILDYGFQSYKSFAVAEKGAKVKGEISVTGGKASSVPLELGGDMNLLIKRGDEQQIDLQPHLPKSLLAPVALGQKVGTVDVIRGGVKVGEIPVVASENVDRQNYGTGWSRVFESWFFR